MKTTIKIHDTEWFKEHCKVIDSSDRFSELKPKYDLWKNVMAVTWIRGDPGMDSLEGRVLESVFDSGFLYRSMASARYRTKGYWIPNWAIEWVKEEQE